MKQQFWKSILHQTQPKAQPILPTQPHPKMQLINIVSYCRSDFMTLPSVPLQEQSDVVLLRGRHLASWLLALGERGGHGNLRDSDCLSVIPYIHRRTDLYCAQVCLT
jgi:hypothetical protein